MSAIECYFIRQFHRKSQRANQRNIGVHSLILLRPVYITFCFLSLTNKINGNHCQFHWAQVDPKNGSNKSTSIKYNELHDEIKSQSITCVLHTKENI